VCPKRLVQGLKKIFLIPLLVAIASGVAADCDNTNMIGADPRDSLLPIETFLPMVNPGSNTNQQSFLRFVNPNDNAVQVEIYGIDDGGTRSPDGAVSFSLSPNESKQITVQDLESGNAEKGLTNRLCDGQGKWQLRVRSDDDLDMMGLIRTPDGFLTSLNDVVPLENGNNVAYFANPASNINQQTFLRVVNTTGLSGTVTITGTDDVGMSSDGSVTFTLSAYESKQMTAQDLEVGNAGKELTGSLGDGIGKWRLNIASDLNLEAMSLIRTTDGFLTNLSGMAAANVEGDYPIYFANPASEETRTTFLRIINVSEQIGDITISAVDDDGNLAPGGTVTFSLDPRAAKQLTAPDLEDGNLDKGLSGALGDGVGKWRLTVSADVDIRVMSLIRTPDGFLTNLSRAAPVSAGISDVSIFNPASNTNQASVLRLINNADTQGQITITGVDDAGNASDEVTFNIVAQNAVDLSAQELENGNGDKGLVGRLGDGSGKWRLSISSDVELRMQSLLTTPTGFLTNLSRAVSRNTDRASTLFVDVVSPTIIQGKCIGCHVSGGAAAATELVYVRTVDDDHEQTNFDLLKNYVAGDAALADRILSKAQGGLSHGGGIQLTNGSTDYANLVEFLDRLGGDITDENRSSGEDQSGVGSGENVDDPIGNETATVGYPTFLSPHAKPIAINGDFVYVANTAADTIEVIETSSREVRARINVGVDPVGVAVRPDGRQVWVANHVSDTVSVIDTDAGSPTYHHVIASVQDMETLATRFDEPVGVTFADNQKAYVALSPQNEIAIVDVETYSVVGRLPISAQDPRAITVREDRLYVIPFESNNQTQLSGCWPFVPSDICTFDAREHIFTNNNVLSLDYDADIIKNPDLPDRDLYVFDTATDELVEIVDTVGTLLYDLTVDSEGKVYVAQTDARNDVNGRAGTLKHSLFEMENRAFLNQITSVDCSGDNCDTPVYFDLEPLPPVHPEKSLALATPYGIQISDDDETLLVTAAGSNKLFTVDTDTGSVLGRAEVGAVPRGIAIESADDGSPRTAWVLNVADNTVSVVNVSSPATPFVEDTVVLEDPSDPVIKAGRIAFNDANMSSTGTFSCESCHPDGHTDQLIWVLKTPPCAGDDETYDNGCTQIPPRLTMPVRGIRDTTPLHWDGIPGDPYGGINTASITEPVEPNCSIDDPESCARVLVNGSLESTMCLVDENQLCNDMNEDGDKGLLGSEQRDSISKFLLSVLYPPAQQRPMTNQISANAVEGYQEFNFEKDCGTCHRMPFLVSTNTGGTGMDAPTWRGAYDRWMITPQGRTNNQDLLVDLVGIPDHFPERDIWLLAGASENIWQMVLELGTGFSGSYARQLTLNSITATSTETSEMLSALEQSASEGGILLQAHGAMIGVNETVPIDMAYQDGAYRVANDAADPGTSRQEVIDMVAAGELILTLTGKTPQNVGFGYPQPGLWPIGVIEQQSGVIAIAHLSDELTLRMKGRHIRPGANIILDGRKVDGTVTCESGVLPDCLDETILITLADLPAEGGMYFLQVQNVNGKFSNDTMVFSDQSPVPRISGNLIGSGGTFSGGASNWDTNEFIGSINFNSGRADINISPLTSDTEVWWMELRHGVMVVDEQQYTFCFEARANAGRTMTGRVDTGANQFEAVQGSTLTVNLNTGWRNFSTTFTADVTDVSARVVFFLAQSSVDMEIDNVGLYEGSSCGEP